MARKIELGLKGYFIPQFFDRKYIKQESSPGSNSWLIRQRIHTLPLKDYNLYKSVVKVIANKENESKMKVALPTIKQMNERQRRKEFNQEKKDFPDNHPKKKLSIKPKEGEGNFEQELFVISGNETAEQFVMWLKTLTEELIIPQRVTWAKMEAALHALTSGEAKEELTLAFCELKNKAQTAWTDDMWTKDVVHSYFVQSKLKETYTDQAKLTVPR